MDRLDIYFISSGGRGKDSTGNLVCLPRENSHPVRKV